MISLLKVINFQSHRRSIFKFHKGMNVVVGTSDSGKSVIIRALDWALNNDKPSSGDAFRSDWGGDTKVIATVDDRRLIRKKTATKNLYKLDGTIFKAFGQSVPDEISQLVNLADINWQRQHDSPYLLSNTPGEVARVLNEIVHLEKIDTSLSAAVSNLRSLNQNLRMEKEEAVELRAKLKSFTYLDDMEKDVAALSKIEKKIVALDSDIIVLNTLVEGMEEKEEELSEAKKIHKQKSAYELQRDILLAILRDYEAEENLILNETTKLKEMKLKLKKEMPDECPLCGRSG